MDKATIESGLSKFFQTCLDKGYPIEDSCLEEAYSGDSSTSYILKVKATWIDSKSCTEAIDILFDILFETTDFELRKYIFSIQLNDCGEVLQCNTNLFESV